MELMQWFPRLKKPEWIVLLSLIVAYLAITLANLTKLPIFVDEALYLRWAQIAWHDASWRFISLTDGKQPLYVWAVIPFMKLISDPLLAGRLVSALSGLGTLLGVMYAGWLLSGKKLAFWSGLVTLFSPFLFFYNRFAVMEGMMLMFGIWIFNGAIMLARTRRLDVALLLGMWTGLGMLVKSPATFFLLLTPTAYLLEVDFKKIFTKKTWQYAGLVAVVWGLGAIIYNVQRLSPWMHMIAQKNAFFIVPYNEIFAEPQRLTNNFLDIWRWHGAYTTIPVLLLALWGLVAWAKESWRKGLLTLAWFFLPVLGTILLARLFAPRYMVFTTPFLFLFAGYALTTVNSAKVRTGVYLLSSLLPLLLIGKLIFNPLHFPYVNVDEGYVNGWSAGNGVKQMADWAVERTKETGKPMTIYTEGTFGILPHGLELYADGRTNLLTIIGLYPINEIPPSETRVLAKKNQETYFILNNTEKKEVPAGLELIATYPKLRDNPMNLYRVLPPTK
jgi:4-amino-4-deoxy-L-arabinose transferase-like glycosyltransferase